MVINLASVERGMFRGPRFVMTRPAMSQGDLYLLLPLAWQSYLDYLPAFSAFRPSYTAKVAEDGLKLLEKAMQLPDDQARGAAAERTRALLLPQVTEYLDAWLLLEGYIEEAYGDAGYKPMREEAGGKYYVGATEENWESVTRLISSARRFVTEHLDELTANDNMPAAFVGTLEAEAQDVEGLLKQFLKYKADELKGTTAKEAANAAAFDAWRKVARDADRIFRRKPDDLKFFQTEFMLGIVRGTGQAGLRGRLTLADGSPAAGVTVQVAGAADARAVTDEDGRYALAVAAGTYTVELSGAGYAPQTLAGVEVQPGVKKRLDGVMAAV